MSILKLLDNIFPFEIIELILQYQEIPKKKSCCVGIYCRTCKTYRNCRYHKCYYRHNRHSKVNFRYTNI
jgi:hypothetical protein